MIITISGEAGSGKSSVAKTVAENLEFKHYSIGDFMGELANERNISLLELSKLAEDSDEIDRILDNKQIHHGKTEDNFVVDSRLAWHFIPKSIKIFLTVDLDEGARRIYNTNREDEPENISLEKTKENILIRKESEIKRYKDYYDIDYFDMNHYDLIIDTTTITVEQAAEQIQEFVKHFGNI